MELAGFQRFEQVANDQPSSQIQHRVIYNLELTDEATCKICISKQ